VGYRKIFLVGFFLFLGLVPFVEAEEYPLQYFLSKATSKTIELSKKERAELFNQLDEIEFLGRTFKVPHNPEEYLNLLYGENWREPHPEITIWISKNCKPLNNKIITYQRYIPINNEMK